MALAFGSKMRIKQGVVTGRTWKACTPCEYAGVIGRVTGGSVEINIASWSGQKSSVPSKSRVGRFEVWFNDLSHDQKSRRCGQGKVDPTELNRRRSHLVLFRCGPAGCTFELRKFPVIEITGGWRHHIDAK